MDISNSNFNETVSHAENARVEAVEKIMSALSIGNAEELEQAISILDDAIRKLANLLPEDDIAHQCIKDLGL